LPFQEAFKFSASESKTVNYGFVREIDAFRKNTMQVVRKTLVTADLAMFRGMTACFFFFRYFKGIGSIAVMLQIGIREVLASNLGRKANFPD